MLYSNDENFTKNKFMSPLKTLYLDTLKKSLMDILNTPIPESLINPPSLSEHLIPEWFDHFCFGKSLTLCTKRRLDNVQTLLEDCLKKGIPGDIVECGTWRGGMSILIRGVLAANDIKDKTVWVADSFQGLPQPKPGSVDENLYNHEQVIKAQRFAVPMSEVKSNFSRYDLLDEQVKFLPGWFKDTLPQAPIDKIALLHLDSDDYNSTMDVLVNLYPKIVPGGYIILDDWGIGDLCGEQQAIIDYRQSNNITTEIIDVDYHSAYWQKN